MTSSASSPCLVELCVAVVGANLASFPRGRLNLVPPRLCAFILKHAISSGRFDEDLLHLFDERSLVLSGSLVTDRGLELVVSNCGSQLVELAISRCVRVHDSGVCSLVWGCKNLRKLDLSYCRLSDAAVDCAARCCPGLRALDYSWNGSGMGDGSVRALAAHCPKLQASIHDARTSGVELMRTRGCVRVSCS